jgi:hypothetical protein
VLPLTLAGEASEPLTVVVTHYSDPDDRVATNEGLSPRRRDFARIPD